MSSSQEQEPAQTGAAGMRVTENTMSGADTNGSEDDCHFLELPAELPDYIYDLVLLEDPPVMPRNTKKKLLTESALLRANKQIHAELRARALYGPMPIKTMVINYQFGHIITHLNRLDDVQIKRMTAEDKEQSAKRHVEITLVFTSEPDPLTPEHFCRWLNRLAKPGKKGTEIKIKYTAPRPPTGYRHLGRDVLHDVFGACPTTSVQRREVKKIMDAMSLASLPPTYGGRPQF